MTRLKRMINASWQQIDRCCRTESSATCATTQMGPLLMIQTQQRGGELMVSRTMALLWRLALCSSSSGSADASAVMVEMGCCCFLFFAVFLWWCFFGLCEAVWFPFESCMCPLRVPSAARHQRHLFESLDKLKKCLTCSNP